jgi:enolase-phosphatase E1
VIQFSGRGLLLDVEGTCSSVRYVHDVLFNYARQQLEPYLRSHWDTDALAAAREIVARETGAESFAEWTKNAPRQQAREQLHRELMRQIDRDSKTTGLKEVQGLIWREGFEAGKLHTHIYPDVPLALRRWTDTGRAVRIYSSGSVLTQKLFFANTEVGSLIPFLSGHYDTMIGSKRDNASYAKIAADWGIPAAEIIFLSDIVAELDAARTAGMRTALLTRPENSPVEDRHDHPPICSFSEIELAKEPRTK